MSDLITALAAVGGCQADCQRFNDYYDGNHKLTFATKKFDDAFGALFNEFADNLCPVVVDSLVDKLSLTGFVDEAQMGAPPDASGNSPSELAWDIWMRNRMDEGASEVHTDAAIDGNSFVVVWPNEAGEAVLYANGADRITVHYNEEDAKRIDWAAKIWTLEDLRVRATMYYPDRIEKWITAAPQKNGLPEKDDNFVEFKVEREAWPLANPYGRVPVFHFANNSRRGKRGASELKDVIPLQDALNKSVCDMLVGQEFVALPQRYGTGLEVPTDPATGRPLLDPNTGRPLVPFYYGADRFWAVGDKDVRFGEFPGANLEPFLKAQENIRLEIARISRTPLHYIVPIAGQAPSGRALQHASEPFMDKVSRRQIAFGNVWEDVLGFALLVEHGQSDVMLQAQWADVAPKDELAMMQVLTAKAQLVGVSTQQILREAGYSDGDINDMAEEIAATPKPAAPDTATASSANPNAAIHATINSHLAELKAAMADVQPQAGG